MFNMGFTEIIVLGTIALLIIGPKQLPHVARSLAKMINEFKRATSGVTSVVKEARTEVQNVKNHAHKLVQDKIGNVLHEVNKKPEEKSEEKPISSTEKEQPKANLKQGTSDE